MKGDNAAGHYVDLFVLSNSEKMQHISIGEFVGGLAEVFIPMALCCQAKRELYTLKQGKGTVEDYFTHLKQLAM